MEYILIGALLYLLGRWGFQGFKRRLVYLWEEMQKPGETTGEDKEE